MFLQVVHIYQCVLFYFPNGVVEVSRSELYLRFKNSKEVLIKRIIYVQGGNFGVTE